MSIKKISKEGLAIAIPVGIAIVLFFVVFRFFIPAILRNNEEIKPYIPMVSFILTIVIANFSMNIFTMQWYARLLEIGFKPILLFIPFLKSLYIVQIFSVLKEEMEDNFNSLMAVSLLPLVAEAYCMLRTVLFGVNIFREGIEYMTDEVSVAFIKMVSSFILLIIVRYFVYSIMLGGLSKSSHVTGALKYKYLWFVMTLLWFIYFMAQRFIPALAGLMSVKIFNIFVFVLPLTVLPFFTYKKIKAVISDMLYETMENKNISIGL